MLHTISWQQYFTALIICLAAWYSYIWLRFYKPQPKTLSVIPPVALTPVMGGLQPDTDTGLYEAEELVFGKTAPDDISDQTLAKGPSDDLLAEAEILIMAYADNDDKPGFLSLLKILVSKYEVFAEEISLPTVINSLKKIANTQLPFALSDTEWPLKFNA